MSEPTTTLRAAVDHDLCAGVGQCLLEAPGAFRYDEEGMSIFDPRAEWTEDELRRAAGSCPMGAIGLIPSGD